MKTKEELEEMSHEELLKYADNMSSYEYLYEARVKELGRLKRQIDAVCLVLKSYMEKEGI